MSSRRMPQLQMNTPAESNRRPGLWTSNSPSALELNGKTLALVHITLSGLGQRRAAGPETLSVMGRYKPYGRAENPNGRN